MALFDYLKSGADKRADEVRSGAVAPSREERQKCWVARDAYFGCLDANNIVDALKDSKAAARACGSQSADFERDCAAQWVSSDPLEVLVSAICTSGLATDG
jgi:cytochrome c oxidase assembly factor 6